MLIDTFAAVDAPSGADMMARLDRLKSKPWYADAMKAMHTVPKTSAELTARLRRMMPLYLSDTKTLERYRDAFAATTFSAAAFQGRIASKRMPFNLLGRLHNVTAPVLIVVGGDDVFSSPASATRMHLHLPHSKFLLIEHAGHFPWLEQPAVFEEQVPKFLTALGLSAK